MTPPDDIKEHISYDPETGVFRCIQFYSNRVKVGQVIGSRNKAGYVEIRYRWRLYLAHRLAWWLVHGELPRMLDHRNRNPSDNRISNLRVCSNSQSAANTRRSGRYPKGVRRNTGCRTWSARIRGKHLGCFDTIEEAANAYDGAARAEFGEFACTNFGA